ncbi:MAG: hypothetical protein IJX47_09990 [Clostridia bacterium]|nr:hypothetical protein [Clostridia bacterium]
MKKFCVFASLLSVSLLLFACGNKTDAPADTTASTEAPAQDLVVTENGATEYKIVRGQRTSDGVKSVAIDLRTAMIDALGAAPTLSDDFVMDDAALTADTPEILIGETNRPDSIALQATLPEGNSYAIAVKGSRIVIVATNEAVLSEAVDYFIETYVKTAEGGKLMLKGDLLITETLTDFVRKGWELSCPSPMTGSLAEGFYNSGSGLADDVRKETDEYSRMQVVSDVTKADFEAYVEEMKAAGYTQILDNTIGKNLYAEFTKDALTWHISFTDSTDEIRVSEDRAGTPLSEFAYDTVGDRQTVVYQYGLYYDPNNQVTDKTVNCGMLYVIRLSDNSLVLVDGGHLHQSSDAAIEGLWSFLHEITDTAEGETIRVAAWYITHAHGDHVTGTSKLLNRYHDEIDLQRVMYNIPSYQVRSAGYDDNTTTAKEIVRKYYPDVKFLKLHSGQNFHLSDVGFEVLFTHEDAVGLTQFEEAAKNGGNVQFPLGDYNCTSTVLRLTVDGQTVLLLGDTNVEAEAAVKKTFPASVWKSDAVQVAHHCFNYLDTLYPMIAAPIALMPNSYFGSHTPENLPKLATVLKYVENDQIYYEGEQTVGLAVVDGKLTVVYEAPVVGGEYDFSGM